MERVLVTTGTVDNGKVSIRNRDAFNAGICALKGEIEITARQIRATRSAPQNRYYWAVIVALLSEHTGYTPDEVHALLKAKFLPKVLAVQDGNGEIKGEFVIGGTTRTLNKNEFSEYCEAIRRWAAMELDVVIPDPDDGRRP